MKRYAFLVKGTTDEGDEDSESWDDYLVIAHDSLGAFNEAFKRAQDVEGIELQAMKIVRSKEID